MAAREAVSHPDTPLDEGRLNALTHGIVQTLQDGRTLGLDSMQRTQQIYNAFARLTPQLRFGTRSPAQVAQRAASDSQDIERMLARPEVPTHRLTGQ
ncbi:MAG TPA: hypothetical protein VHS99_11210 [Chloroflexota bacterium]|nr:hypothetical protein [Chloroflexota bacterium]